MRFQLANGKGPDIFLTSGYFAKDYISSNKVSALDSQTLSGQIPSLQKALGNGAIQYNRVWNFYTLAMYYNTELFNQAGEKAPNIKDTSKTLIKKIVAVQNKYKPNVFGTCFQNLVYNIIDRAYKLRWKYPVPVTSDQFAAAFNFYIELNKPPIKKVQYQGFDSAIRCITEAKAATGFDGNWASSYLDGSSPPIPIGTSLVPRGTGPNADTLLVFSDVWMINRNSTNQAAAMKVLSALTSEKAQLYLLELQVWIG